jgi:hypothetical protein
MTNKLPEIIAINKGEMSLQKKPEKERNGYKDKQRLQKLHEIACVVCDELGLKQTSRTIAHHKIGLGLGLKASDLLTCSICENHHNTSPEGIHNMPLHKWEAKYFTQDKLIELTNDRI